MTAAEKLRMARRLSNLDERYEGTPDLAELIAEQEQMEKERRS